MIETISAKEYNRRFGGIMKTNKYGAKKTEIQGKKFHSQSEGQLWWELEQQRKQGLIANVQCQAKEELSAYGVHITNYYVDFLVTHNDGSLEYIEHKSSGTVTDGWRIKYKMLEAKHKNDPNIKIKTNWYNQPKTIKAK